MTPTLLTACVPLTTLLVPCRKESLDNIPSWLDEIQDGCSDYKGLILVGTKYDLWREKQECGDTDNLVTQDDINNVAEEIEASHAIATSARTGHGLPETDGLVYEDVKEDSDQHNLKELILHTHREAAETASADEAAEEEEDPSVFRDALLKSLTPPPSPTNKRKHTLSPPELEATVAEPEVSDCIQGTYEDFNSPELEVTVAEPEVSDCIQGTYEDFNPPELEVTVAAEEDIVAVVVEDATELETKAAEEDSDTVVVMVEAAKAEAAQAEARHTEAMELASHVIAVTLHPSIPTSI